MAIQHADSTIGLLNSVSNVLDKSLRLFPISDVAWIRQFITDELGDIVKDIEKSLEDMTAEQLADQVDDIGNDINAEHHDEDSPLAQDMNKDFDDAEKEAQDIMGDDYVPDERADDIASTPPQDEPDEGLGLDDDEENPMEDIPEDQDAPEQPESSPTETSPDTEQPGQQEDYKPFTEDMPEIKGGLGQTAKTGRDKDMTKGDAQMSPSQKQQKMRQLEQLKQATMTKQQKKVEKNIAPFKKKIKEINKEINEIDDKLKTNRNNMILATAMMGLWVAISLIVLMLGFIICFTIILAIPVGIPMLEWGTQTLIQTLTKYATKMGKLVTERLELIKDKMKEEKEKDEQQKKMQKVQALSNKKSFFFSNRIDRQIQKLQQS